MAREQLSPNRHRQHAARFRDRFWLSLALKLRQDAPEPGLGQRLQPGRRAGRGRRLAWAGVTLAPALEAVLMGASTIVVALNAQLLRRLDLQQRR
jgi:sulfur carrier protein ThiS